MHQEETLLSVRAVFRRRDQKVLLLQRSGTVEHGPSEWRSLEAQSVSRKTF